MRAVADGHPPVGRVLPGSFPLDQDNLLVSSDSSWPTYKVLSVHFNLTIADGNYYRQTSARVERVDGAASSIAVQDFRCDGVDVQVEDVTQTMGNKVNVSVLP